jgi:hypothetical protein
MTTRLAPLIAIAVASCVAVPALPSYQVDVAPILAARCVRCHGDPPIGGAPSGFVLDGYPDRTLPDGTVVLGAASYAASIARRAAARTMPPRFPLDDDQVELLTRWAAEAPAPGQPAPRGMPRPDNRRPVLALDPVGSAAWRYELHDPDGDLVVGELRAQLGDGAPGVVISTLHSGRGEIQWNTASIPTGRYRLTAELDDGGEASSLELGTTELP